MAKVNISTQQEMQRMFKAKTKAKQAFVTRKNNITDKEYGKPELHPTLALTVTVTLTVTLTLNLNPNPNPNPNPKTLKP